MEELNMKRRELEDYQYNNTFEYDFHKQSSAEQFEEDFDDDDVTLYDDDEDLNFDEGLNSTEDGENIEEKSNHIISEDLQSETNRGSELDVLEMEGLNDLIRRMQNNEEKSIEEEAKSRAVGMIEKINNKTEKGLNNSLETRDENFNLNSSSCTKGETELDSTPSKPLGMLTSMLYIRDKNWEIPDIVPQLQKWNNDEIISFSREFENEMIEEIMEERNDILNDEDEEGR